MRGLCVVWRKIPCTSRVSIGMGALAKESRIAPGALIIKERLGVTDEEAVAQIRENPFLQYFLGLHESLRKELFDPSMMVHFRKLIIGASSTPADITYPADLTAYRHKCLMVIHTLHDQQLEMYQQRGHRRADRIPIEGKFGNAKRKGTLQRVMAKLAVTSRTVVTIGLCCEAGGNSILPPRAGRCSAWVFRSHNSRCPKSPCHPRGSQ